jgi:hypothetical protein
MRKQPIKLKETSMSTDYTIVDGWESLSAAEAIKAAVDRHGKDGTGDVTLFA